MAAAEDGAPAPPTVTVARAAADGAAVPVPAAVTTSAPCTATNALPMATVILSGAKPTTSPVRRLSWMCAQAAGLLAGRVAAGESGT